ncbi:MAG: hypothetical protein WDW36_008307 [Sanguina aurantia]
MHKGRRGVIEHPGLQYKSTHHAATYAVLWDGSQEGVDSQVLRWSKIEVALTDEFCTESLWVLPCVLAYQNSNYHELTPAQLKDFEDGVRATRLTRASLKKQRTANLKPLKDRLSHVEQQATAALRQPVTLERRRSLPREPNSRHPLSHRQDKPVAMTPEGDFVCMLDADDRRDNPDHYSALYPTKPAPRKRGAPAAGIGAAAAAPKRVRVGRSKAAAAGATATPGAAAAAEGGRKAAGTLILSEAKAAAARAQGAAAGGSSSKGKKKAGGGGGGVEKVKPEPGSRAEGVTEGDEEYPAEQEADAAEMAEWEFTQSWTGKLLPRHLALAAGDKTLAQTAAEEAAGRLAEEPEAEYVIERIMDAVLLPSERSGRRVKHFLVKWEGYELNPGTGPEARDLGSSWLTSEQLKGNRMRNAWVKAPPAWWRRQQPGPAAAAAGPGPGPSSTA